MQELENESMGLRCDQLMQPVGGTMKRQVVKRLVKKQQIDETTSL
jgi:hypothetical protein